MSGFRAALSSRWFKLTLSLILLALLFYETDLTQLRRMLLRAHPGWLLLAVVGYELSQVVSSVRWCVLARAVGFTEPYRRFFAYYFSGMYLNLFAPSTVAGDIGRAFFLARGRKRRALALTSVIADRGLGFVALIWVGAAAIVLLPRYPVPHALHLAALVIPPLTIAGWLWGPLLAVRILSPENRWRVLVEKELARYWNDPRLLLGTSMIAGSFHLLQVATQVWLAWAIGMDVPWSYFLIFVPVVNIAGMIPVSLSGIGIREGGYWYFLSLVGVDKEAAIALGLLSSAIVLMAGLSGGPVFVLQGAKAPGEGPTPAS